LPDTTPRSQAHEPRWHDWALLRRGQVPAALCEWLLDRGSLTRHLVHSCPGVVRVEVRRQAWAHPLPGERRLLGLRPGTLTLVREVELRCTEHPWVFARTLIPAATLRGGGHRLARLGERPLGALLFADPGVRRDRVEVTLLGPQHTLFRQAVACLSVPPHSLWARRTLFLMKDRPLLVNEIFLPGLPPR
jgi:chorismate--pyruvate lyase